MLVVVILETTFSKNLLHTRGYFQSSLCSNINLIQTTTYAIFATLVYLPLDTLILSSIYTPNYFQHDLLKLVVGTHHFHI